MKHFDLEFDFAPVYECVNSMNAFFYKQNHQVMEAGKLWVREVQQQFAPVVLQRLRENMKTLEDLSLFPFIWRCPGNRSVPEFLEWFTALSTGELYEIAASVGSSIPPNLGEFRDRAAELIREWDKHYFHSVDPAIIEGLTKEAAIRKKQVVNETNLADAVEQATGGMKFYPGDRLKRIILTPQFHIRPLVSSSIYDEFIFTQYSCDVIPPSVGHPAPHLLRITSALSDETRLRILRLLSQNQMTFTEIVREIGISKSTIHYHLITLRAAGLVIVHYKSSESKNVEYSLRLKALHHLPEQIDLFLQS